MHKAVFDAIHLQRPAGHFGKYLCDPLLIEIVQAATQTVVIEIFSSQAGIDEQIDRLVT